jgi:hypothetical protein
LDPGQGSPQSIFYGGPVFKPAHPNVIRPTGDIDDQIQPIAWLNRGGSLFLPGYVATFVE